MNQFFYISIHKLQAFWKPDYSFCGVTVVCNCDMSTMHDLLPVEVPQDLILVPRFLNCLPLFLCLPPTGQRAEHHQPDHGRMYTW